MYDTVFLRLTQANVGGVCAKEEITVIDGVEAIARKTGGKIQVKYKCNTIVFSLEL